MTTAGKDQLTQVNIYPILSTDFNGKKFVIVLRCMSVMYEFLFFLSVPSKCPITVPAPRVSIRINAQPSTDVVK